MKRRSKRDDDYLGPSRGWAKVLHRTVMFILLPLRKPWWTLLVLLTMFLVPTFRGVKPAEVHLWYWRHLTNFSGQTASRIADKAQQVLPSMDKVVGTITNAASEYTSKEPEIFNQPLRQVRRKTFEKATGETRKLAMEKAPELQPITGEPAVVENHSVSAPAPVEKVVIQKPKLDLRYLDTPEKLSGKPKILNANELDFNGTIVFLYGIYAAPSSDSGLMGKFKLSELLDGKDVDCEINAYTFQNIPTAICYVGEVEINRWMVNHGYSKNVALDK